MCHKLYIGAEEGTRRLKINNIITCVIPFRKENITDAGSWIPNTRINGHCT